MDQITLVKNQYRLEQWTRLIQDCQSSGMRVDDWCEANGVTHHAYYYWLRKVKEALLVESGFVEVTQPKQFPVQRSVTADPNEIFASSVIPDP